MYVFFKYNYILHEVYSILASSVDYRHTDLYSFFYFKVDVFVTFQCEWLTVFMSHVFMVGLSLTKC